MIAAAFAEEPLHAAVASISAAPQTAVTVANAKSLSVEVHDAHEQGRCLLLVHYRVHHAVTSQCKDT